MSVKEFLLEKVSHGTVHLTLIDPDNQSPEEAADIALKLKNAGTDAIMIGGSTGVTTELADATAVAIKERTGMNVIFFPSGVDVLPTKCDAVLFMSVVNSTRMEFVLGAHMRLGPYFRNAGVETISMGYVIVEPGMTVGKVTQANLIKRDDLRSAVAHAVGCEILGMDLVYLEAGSGADRPVPPEMIAAVKKNIEIPLIVGGGIRDAESARAARLAGANIIVTGTIVERCKDEDELRRIVAAIKGTE